MSLASGSIDLKSLKVAGEGASKYITEINNGGITIHDSQNIDVDYAIINSEGMAIFHGDDIPVAQFGDDVRIGKEDDAHIELNNYGMTAISSEGTPYFKVSASGASFIEAVKQPVAIKTYDDELFSRQNTWAMSEIVSSDVWDSLNDGDEFYCTFWGILHDKSDDGRTVYPTEKTYFLRTKQFIKGTTKSYTEETSYGFRVGYSATNNAIAMTLNYQTSPPLYYIKSLCCQFYINEVRAAPCYAIGPNMMDFGDPFAITFGDGTLPSAYGVSLGRYNIDDENNNNVFTIGNGTDPENRANAFTIDWDGNVNANGNIISGGNIVIPNGSAYKSQNSSGDERRLCYISTANNYIYGYDSYQNGEGGSYLYGNTLGIRSKGNITIGIAADSNTIYMNGIVYPNTRIVMPNNVSIRAKTANGNNDYQLIFASDSNNIVVGSSSWNDCYIHRVYSSGTGTVSTVPNVRILDNSRLTRTTHANSSIKIKHDIKDIENKELDPHRLYGVEVKQFIYNDDVITDKNDCRYHKEIAGFIAEQLHECYPIAVDINEKGECEAWQAQYIIPPMLKLIQEQHEEIEQLKKEVVELKNR